MQNRGIILLVYAVVFISILSLTTFYIISESIKKASAARNQHQLEDTNSRIALDNPDGGGGSISSIGSSNENKFVVINFDDGYRSQFTAAKPVLDRYGFKASFFIVCNFIGKTAKEMNTTSIGSLNGDGNFTGKGVDQMIWPDILTLYKEGYQIGSHSMNHFNNMSRMSDAKLEYELGQSKQCLLNHGIVPVNTFSYPFSEGQYNATIVAKESKYYSYVRTGDEPLMFLHCNHYHHKSSQTDCRTYLPNGKVTFANRYSMIGWNPEVEKSKYPYNDILLLQRFIQVVNSQLKYNQQGQPAEAIPIIYYHRIDNSGALYSTHSSLFAEEMKYLHDNDFKVIRMDDLVYDNATNWFYLKNQ
jgi:peptidoglycan/xylan/chitin deacetylase (PgdA/CDA1 family)